MHPSDLLTQILAPHLELPRGEIEALAGALRPVRYAKGAIVFAQGEVCTDLVILCEGLTRAYYVDADGREVNLRFLAPPNVATSMTSLITGEPAREWVAAITEVRGFRGARSSIMERSTRADRLMRVLAEQHYLSMERRLRMLQLKHVRDRYAFYRSELDPQIVDAMPEFHVASYLGVAPETLSRNKTRRS